MACNCGSRALRLIERLGFSHRGDNLYSFSGRSGTVVLRNVKQQHFRSTVIALFVRALL